jgi:hypothetical protein
LEVENLMKRLLLGALVGLLFIAVGSALSQEPTTYVVNSVQAVNARACPRLDCAIIAALAPGTLVQVTETVTGDEVFGSNLWWRMDYDGTEAYLHSALLEPAPDVNGDPPESEGVDTNAWVEHEIAGASILAPPDWQDATAYWTGYTTEADSESVQATQQTVLQESPQQAANPDNHIILVDPLSVASVEIWVDYSGIDVSLLATKPFLEDRVESWDQQLISSQLVRLPAADVVRLRTQIIYDDENPSLLYDDERLIYYLEVDRVEYTINLTARQVIFEDLLPLLEAIAQSFNILSSDAARSAFIQPAGSAQAGENSGQLNEGWVQMWTYEAQAGDLVNIRVTNAGGASSNLDPYLLIRAPDGQVIAENDDSGLFNLSTDPHIRRLELPETGTYEIEVHAYDGFNRGDYTLIIESGAARATPEPKGDASADRDSGLRT